MFYRLLVRVIKDDSPGEGIDLSSVEMTFFKAHKQEAAKLGLGGDAEPLGPGVSSAGSGSARDPKMVRLAEIVDQLNTLFDDTAFTDADRVAIYNHIVGKMAESEDLQEQAKANNAEQFADSPDLTRTFLAAVIDAMTNHGAMSEKLLTDEHARATFIRLLVPDLYERMSHQAA